MSLRRHLLSVVLTSMVTVSCVRFGYSTELTESTDAAVADADAGGAANRCSWAGSWTLSTPEPVVELNSPASEGEPILSDDGLTIYFARYSGAAEWDGFVARRLSVQGPFGDIRPNAAINTVDYADSRFVPLAGGLQALFTTTRPGGAGGADIWQISRASLDAAFDPSTAISLSFNTAEDEWDPAPSVDGLRIYYAITTSGGQNLVMVQRPASAGEFSPPTPIEELNSAGFEDNPSLTADERVVVFASDRREEGGLHDLWYATRADREGVFSSPGLLPVVNTPASETEVFISGDGCTVYFGSDRDGGQGGHDLYRTHFVRLSP